MKNCDDNKGYGNASCNDSNHGVSSKSHTNNRQQNESDSGPNADTYENLGKIRSFFRVRTLSRFIFLDKSDDQILTRCLFAENLIEF